MSVNLNQGLRNYQESVTHQIGSLNVTINLCPSASNILIQIPTLNTIGVQIMSPILIYNYQLRSSGGIFRGAKLNYFPTLYKNGNVFYIHNPDGMIDHYDGYNNINSETNSYMSYSCPGMDVYTLIDKYGNKIEYLEYNYSLPYRIVYKNGMTINIQSSSNIPIKIDNVYGDEIYFSYNGSYITNLIYYKDNVIKYKTYFSYTNNKLSGVETKVVDNNIETTIEYYTITESTNSLVVKDEIKDYSYTYTLNNDNQVISYYDSYYPTNITSLSYSDTTTTVTDIFNKITKYYFSNGLPAFYLDSLGYINEKSYDYITKRIKEENRYPLLSPNPNLLPVNMSGFTTSNAFFITSYSETDTNYDFITNKYKITGNYGNAFYSINTQGKYNDTIQFLFYIKVLSGGASNYLQVQLMFGGREIIKSIDLNYQEGYTLTSLELTAIKDYTQIHLEFIGYGIEAVVGSLSVIKNTGVKTYTYTDSNLTNYDSKYHKQDMNYDNNLVESSIGTNLPSTNYKYDSRNNITKEEKPYLTDINNTYNSSNQLLTKELIDINSNKIKEECIYDTNHFLQTKKDSLLNQTTYTYDSFGNVLTITNPLNQGTTYTYDSKLNIASITKTNKTITYGYNTKNMISSVSISNGNTYSFTYDTKDNLDSVSINNETIGSYSYDTYGRLSSSSYGFSFIYDVDKLTTIKYNNSTLYSIEYDTKDRIEEIKDPYNRTLEEYIYDDEDRLDEKNIRELNVRYDYSDNEVGSMLYTLGNTKEYQSYNSIQKSFNTSKEAILHQFEKEVYVGEYRESYKLKYKNTLKLPNGSPTFERYEDNYIPYIKPGSSLSYTSNDNKLMIGFWFKPEEHSSSNIFTINQNRVYLGVFLDYNDYLHLFVDVEGNSIFTNICTDNQVHISSWNYFGFEYYDDGNEKKVIFELNDEIKVGNVDFSLVSPFTYHIGYKSYYGEKTAIFSGGISNLMIGKDVLNERYIYFYYLYTKNYIYNNQIENSQQIPYITTSSFRNVTGLNYDLIPLENNFKSKNGITPIRLDVNQDLFYDASKTFAYNSYYKRYCYLAYGNKLVYDFDFTNNGTVFLKGSILETKEKQYFITIKNEFGKSISVYRNQNKHIKLKYDYYEVDTGYTLNNGPFFVGVSYNEIVNNNTRVMAVFFGNNSSTCSFSLSNSFNHPKVYIGTDSDGNNALMGMILDICYKKEYITSIPSSISNLTEYHKNSYYDSFGRSNQVSIYKNNVEVLRDTYSFKTTNDNDNNTYTSLLVNKETFKINNTNYERNYTLDDLGRVTSITDSTFGSHTYTYNNLGYLSLDDNKNITYDSNGNITSYGTNTYTYDNLSRLVSYNNNSITYSTNHKFLMTKFNGYTYIYQGKRLVTVTKGYKGISYTYDLEGLIIKKVVIFLNASFVTNYYYDNRKLIKEVQGDNVISYFYDNNNQLYGYKENNNLYFYIRDILGNIIGIMDDNGTLLSKFDYDAYGNIINQTGTIISNFRYKGYYYDTDVELYYLKSRFYNPVLLRFITPDSIEYLDSSSIIGLNLYAYCGNDPVNMIDEEGNFALSTFLLSMAIGAIIGLGMSYASDVVSNAQDGFEWSDLNTFKENWKKYVCATVGGAVSGAFGYFGNVGLSFVGGFAGNMIDNAYTFTNAESVGNSIITSVIAGALSGLGTAISNRLATSYYNRQLSKASSKTAHQISVFLKNMDKNKMPSPSTKAFAILQNTDNLRESARKVADVIVTLLGILY